MRRFLSLLPLVALALFAACGDDAATPSPEPGTPSPEAMTFIAGFKAQADLPFVGVYVAQEKGFFAEENLDVTIEHGTPGTNDSLQRLLAGQAQVSTATLSTVLRNRGGGAPVVAFSLVGQVGEQGLVALKESGITSPKDFEGKTVGYRTFPSPEYIAMLAALEVDRSRITEVNLESPDVRLLTEGQVDVLPAFLSNEPFKLQQLGKEIVTFNPADYGIANYGLTYITSEDVLASRPESLARFLRAATRGMLYAMENPEEAITITLKYAPGENAETQRFLFDTEAAHAVSDLTEANGLGWQTAEQWQAAYKVLRENGGLDKDQDPSKAWTDAILKQTWENGKLRGAQ